MASAVWLPAASPVRIHRRVADRRGDTTGTLVAEPGDPVGGGLVQRLGGGSAAGVEFGEVVGVGKVGQPATSRVAVGDVAPG